MLKLYTNLDRFLWIFAVAFVIFFARWEMVGLQPDAALYAGLSYKVLDTQEYWLLSGTPNKFASYFEHPPFFFQWGSLVLKHLGLSDAAARAIGAIPACLGFFFTLFWIWMRFGSSVALIASTMLLTFGHYTKFAATALLEGPLSLAVTLVAIGTYELFWSEDPRRWIKPASTLLIFVGLMIATATKGVAGLGAWGGLTLSALLAFVFSDKTQEGGFFGTLAFLAMTLFVALIPFGLWAFQLFRHGHFDWIVNYFVEQVLHSASSNRGESFHPINGDKLYYLKVVMKNGWPWWWTVALGWGFLFITPLLSQKFFSVQHLKGNDFKGIAWNAMAFTAAFVIPFTFTKYQLPHYIHPIYLTVLPLGAVSLCTILGSKLEHLLSFIKIRWLIMIALAAFTYWMNRGITTTPNRGQVFYEAYRDISKLQKNCTIQVSKTKMDVYRMEAYSLWYWLGHPYEMIDGPLSSHSGQRSVYWDPENKTFKGLSNCRGDG